MEKSCSLDRLFHPRLTMPAKLKSFTTESGFFELAVAAPSRAAALKAWGMKHDIFAQGLARQSEDKGIAAATIAKPLVVLRRPLGSKAAFTEKAALPEVKRAKPRAEPNVPGDDRAEASERKVRLLRRKDEQEKLAQAHGLAEQAYREKLVRLHREQQEVQTRIKEVSRAWKEQQKQFKVALRSLKAKA